MSRGRKVRVDELQVGKTYLLSHGFGHTVEITYTGPAMGSLWGIPLPWVKVQTFSENGTTRRIESQQVEQNVYHIESDAQ